jgi:(p)ppGpp synthase/HD superfamily hydrolase
MNYNNFEKMSASIRYWMLGKEWYLALKAMEFAAKYHTGLRKDGVTKEFEHQVRQAHIIRTHYKNILHPEETMCVVWLHDVMEDYHVTHETLADLFGVRIADAVRKMSKYFNGIKLNDEVYYSIIGDCVLCSVAKPVDRVDNVSSMDGVFTLEKQESYIKVTKDYTLPMMKAARRKFPEQELFYEAMKLTLNQQITLYESMHKLIKEQ